MIVKMKINRIWAMPSKDTFDCLPIGNLIRKYLKNSKISIDPFSRNKRWATYTNDINPATDAEYHMDSVSFLEMLIQKKIQSDLVIFDPPYSPEQMKRAYDSFGLKMNGIDALRTAGWKQEKDLISILLELNGIFIQCGWSSAGMGIKRHCEILELLLVCHGAGHHDTIVTIEQKVGHQEILNL